VDIRHIEYLMPTATSSCMFASGQILFRISPDRVTGELAAALGGVARAPFGAGRARFSGTLTRTIAWPRPSLAWFGRSILPAWPAR